MNVVFDENAVVYVRFSIYDKVTIKKQEIADYILGKNNNVKCVREPVISERSMLMFYLPFIREIVINDYDSSQVRKIKDNEIKLNFINTEFSSITITISKDLKDFICGR